MPENMKVADKGFSIILYQDPQSIRVLCKRCRQPRLITQVIRDTNKYDLVTDGCTHCGEQKEREDGDREA